MTRKTVTLTVDVSDVLALDDDDTVLALETALAGADVPGLKVLNVRGKVAKYRTGALPAQSNHAARDNLRAKHRYHRQDAALEEREALERPWRR